jgi:hypothetical protein
LLNQLGPSLDVLGSPPVRHNVLNFREEEVAPIRYLLDTDRDLKVVFDAKSVEEGGRFDRRIVLYERRLSRFHFSLTAHGPLIS